MLTTTEDEAAEAEYVAEQVLAHREAGVALKRQAVLFRAAHHSDQLEVELGRRNVPFVTATSRSRLLAESKRTLTLIASLLPMRKTS